ncbi:MAG: transglycosylase SLT domain-containing protein [Fermentimonas sp.]|jgi:membrane-bound lytic murein transglycosylase F
MGRLLSFIVVFFALLLINVACEEKKAVVYDYAEIVESDTLCVLTLNTSTSYFMYRDQPMGFQYDLIKSFCDDHSLNVKIIVAENVKSLIEKLKKGEGDVIAYNLPITNQMRDSIIFCGYKQVSHQVLVQQVREYDMMVKDVVDLIGRTVTVIEDSKYLDRIKNLNDELGGGIVIEVDAEDSLVVEDLIRGVSQGKIDYTVSEDDLAKLNQTYFNNIDVQLPISFDQRSSWAVRPDTPVLADSLDSWFAEKSMNTSYMKTLKRYFEETKGSSMDFGLRVGNFIGNGIISPYDIYFKRYGEEVKIDWRFLASISYQESTFNNEATSWSGAVGLMGLMPATATSYGLDKDKLFDAESNIMIGSRYFRYLMDVFSSTISDNSQVMKMALAAYNGGIGHIFDARALAEKYGADENVWEGNVEKYLDLKRLEQYYSDPVCKNGYFRGDETLKFVSDVINRWELYKRYVEE